MIRILGLDPGLTRTGWGIIDCTPNTLMYVAHGVIVTAPSTPLSTRLCALHQGILDVVQTYSPQQASVEEIFLNKNPHSTLKLGMARGVVLLAPASQGLLIREYSPNTIKKTVVGTGHAQKTQISYMLTYLLPQAGPVKADAADALAIAICHAYHRDKGF